jgi:uncharacterized Zn finger protein
VVKSDFDATLDELISELDINERRYVFARAMVSTDKEAYEEIGVSYNWLNSHGKDHLNTIASELVKDVGFQMMQLIKQNGVNAVQEKIKQLKSRDERIRSQASTELIDRIIGKPTQRVDQKTDGKMEIVVTYEDRRNDTETA